jgi:hypothetical protein
MGYTGTGSGISGTGLRARVLCLSLSVMSRLVPCLASCMACPYALEFRVPMLASPSIGRTQTWLRQWTLLHKLITPVHGWEQNNESTPTGPIYTEPKKKRSARYLIWSRPPTSSQHRRAWLEMAIWGWDFWFSAENSYIWQFRAGWKPLANKVLVWCYGLYLCFSVEYKTQSHICVMFARRVWMWFWD